MSRTRKTEDGAPIHSFRTLLADLATLTLNTMRFGDKLPMTVLSRPTPIQQRAFDLLGVALRQSGPLYLHRRQSHPNVWRRSASCAVQTRTGRRCPEGRRAAVQRTHRPSTSS
jgi:hypothetical protein